MGTSTYFALPPPIRRRTNLASSMCRTIRCCQWGRHCNSRRSWSDCKGPAQLTRSSRRVFYSPGPETSRGASGGTTVTTVDPGGAINTSGTSGVTLTSVSQNRTYTGVAVGAINGSTNCVFLRSGKVALQPRVRFGGTRLNAHIRNWFYEPLIRRNPLRVLEICV